MEEIIADMRRVADEFSDRLLIGELYLPIERLMAYYGRDLTGVHLPFNFTLLTAKWSADALAKLICEYYAALPAGGWPNWVLSNHDRPRVASRVGPAQARVAAMLLLTLHGTPTIYNGDEIGLEQAVISPDQVRDPVELNVPGYAMGRDGCRTPMQWNNSPNGGFTTGEPWLPIQPDYKQRNVVAQQSHADSLLGLYRALIAIRRKSKALIEGELRSVRADSNVLIFERVSQDDHITVALNLSEEPATAFGPSSPCVRLVLSTRPERTDEFGSGTITLAANEGIILSSSAKRLL